MFVISTSAAFGAAVCDFASAAASAFFTSLCGGVSG
jgi:hypothetical protein